MIFAGDHCSIQRKYLYYNNLLQHSLLIISEEFLSHSVSIFMLLRKCSSLQSRFIYLFFSYNWCNVMNVEIETKISCWSYLIVDDRFSPVNINRIETITTDINDGYLTNDWSCSRDYIVVLLFPISLAYVARYLVDTLDEDSWLWRKILKVGRVSLPLFRIHAKQISCARSSSLATFSLVFFFLF